MKILITGITGRIGANVAAELLKQGHEIRGLVWATHDRVDKLEGMDIELIYGTITEMQDAVKAVAGVDAVYHRGRRTRRVVPLPRRSTSRPTSRGPST